MESAISEFNGTDYNPIPTEEASYYDVEFSENPDLLELHDFVQKFISIRKNNQVLIYGDIRIREDYIDLIFFERRLENERIYIIINPTEQKKEFFLDSNFCLTDLLDSSNMGEIGFPQKIELKPFSGKLLRVHQLIMIFRPHPNPLLSGRGRQITLLHVGVGFRD